MHFFFYIQATLRKRRTALNSNHSSNNSNRQCPVLGNNNSSNSRMVDQGLSQSHARLHRKHSPAFTKKNAMLKRSNTLAPCLVSIWFVVIRCAMTSLNAHFNSLINLLIYSHMKQERPPPLPPSRSYTVAGNSKLGYPQTRVMKSTFPGKINFFHVQCNTTTTSLTNFLNFNYAEDGSGEVILRGGEAVMVMGASHRRGHLLVEHKNHHFHVPYQFLELKSNQAGVEI